MQIIGKHALCGRRRNLPSKEIGCCSPLNLNNITNCVLADVDVEATFSRINLKNCGVDLFFCEKVGLNIWVRFKSEVDQNNQTACDVF